MKVFKILIYAVLNIAVCTSQAKINYSTFTAVSRGQVETAIKAGDLESSKVSWISEREAKEKGYSQAPIVTADSDWAKVGKLLCAGLLCYLVHQSGVEAGRRELTKEIQKEIQMEQLAR